MKNKNKWLNVAGYVAIVGAGIILLFFVITAVWIGYDVKTNCLAARKEYGGDCVEALVRTLDDEKKSFRMRNSAVWVLGQLGDGRAAETLKAYYTGNIPERESLDKVISQYELKKAIKLVDGGTNISAFIWRWGMSYL